MPYKRKRKISISPSVISSDYLRSTFLETLVEIAATEELGIAAGCLQAMNQMISDVSRNNLAELRNREMLNKAFADFEEFVLRMVADARQKGYSELHEDTFSAAKGQCGLVFWCR